MSKAETTDPHCGMPWSEHDGGMCPDRARVDLTNEQRERRDRMRDSSVFKAAYPGQCSEGDAIEPGQSVHYVEGHLRHVKCPAEPEGTAGIGKPVRPICARCSQELPVTLVCGWCD